MQLRGTSPVLRSKVSAYMGQARSSWHHTATPLPPLLPLPLLLPLLGR